MYHFLFAELCPVLDLEDDGHFKMNINLYKPVVVAKVIRHAYTMNGYHGT